MLRILFLSIIFLSYSFAVTKNQVYSWYKDKNYKEVCKKGSWIVNKYKNDENYLSIVSLSCLQVDSINNALRISKSMCKTKIGRINASYIANLYLIKRLLIQFIYDKTDLSNLSLPKTNHFLSIVFDNLSKKSYIKQNNKYIIKLKNITYTLEALKKQNNKKAIIIIIKTANSIKKHIFW